MNIRTPIVNFVWYERELIQRLKYKILEKREKNRAVKWKSLIIIVWVSHFSTTLQNNPLDTTVMAMMISHDQERSLYIVPSIA